MKEIKDRDRMNAYFNEYDLAKVLPEPLREHLALYRFEPEEALCLQGEEAHYLFVLVQGKVKVFTTSSEGKTLLINFMTPLGVIGEIECIRGVENLNTVTAVTPVEAIGLHKRWLSQYEEEASLLRFLLDMVTEKFYLKSISLSFNLLHPVEVRLASYLLSVSVENDKGVHSNVNLSDLKDTANMIGTSYRHLNRVLQSFCSHGLVERRRGTLLVNDRTGLTAVAGRNIYETGQRREN
ncbi:cyclic nucleotide-binding domain-containing protein [Paenibacillus sp. LHD-117]|uniref:Crp/Fnr family transcriptional regulator n=1 Tax=Paenibacillus sp. LHD-117 TaxID=3071412 RepID=UPI0027DFD1C1|nr:cyclic nucleotide-binding domain-containing protein [Paenibacillus sp. LHD-117]MDQ6421699.1 cyclic nucleotide-binding domain-containing protein [Paenibacillus sp. LHD-117]